MKTLPTIGLMMLLLVTLASSHLDIVGTYSTEGNFTYDYSVYYDGLLTTPSCDWSVGNITGTGLVNVNLPNNDYVFNMYCTESIVGFDEHGEVNNVTEGGYTSFSFTKASMTVFGLWKPVEDWTFPVIYLIITLLLILFAIVYESSFMGVLGSLMLVFSYFLIGATSPILFAPLLIVGVLLMVRFSSF
jgi:hypothetical protein